MPGKEYTVWKLVDLYGKVNTYTPLTFAEARALYTHIQRTERMIAQTDAMIPGTPCNWIRTGPCPLHAVAEVQELSYCAEHLRKSDRMLAEVKA